MKRFFQDLFSAPFQLALVISFTAIAAATIAIGAWVISRTIDDYLADSMNERVGHDMRLAAAFYQLRLQEIDATAQRLAREPGIVQNLTAGQPEARRLLEEHLVNQMTALTGSGNHCAVVVDAQGRLRAARLVTAGDEATVVFDGGQWDSLPIVRTALTTRQRVAATEVIPAELLAQVGLAQQAFIRLIDTPKAPPTPFDPREGTAGLALIGVSPIIHTGELVGAVIVFHLFNNDFTLVDRIIHTAGIDTVTIFFGDLRVSTNVTDLEGNRAIGTRISAEVGQAVLYEGREYIGTAFVVKENYITRYDPLRDHTGRIIGSLYVGARQASFFRLVNTFRQRIALVALVTILLTFALAVPVSQVITRPLKELKELVGASQRVAQGDMTARVPVRARGQVGLLATSFNIMLDTLQATQDQLVQSEKLASLGQLAAGVAHELNNPLGTILLYADTLLKEIDEQHQHHADLKMVVSETKHCKRIVADLLNFARQQQVIVQPTDVNELFRELIELAPRRVKTVKIDFVAELDPHLPKIEADPAQLRQVLLNLMTNGVEAMPQGGTLTVRTRTGPPGMVTIEIQDTGVGIPSENLGKLFTPFFTTKPIGKGTGLGLAIVYGIIKMHRGQISVKSQEGQGTTFTIQLPIQLQTVVRVSHGSHE